VNWLEDVDGTRTELPGKVTMALTRGQLVVHEQAGAGGYGDPLKRDPGRVLDDILDGKLSVEAGQTHYGVVLTTDARDVDLAATRECRAARRRG